MASPAPVDPNKAIRIARFFAYPKQELYLLASFIALVSLVHHLALLYRYTTRRRVCAPRKPSAARLSLSRLPLAAADSLRALAFRWTVPLGCGYTLNLAEVALTAGYIGVLLSWTFVNTENLQGMLADPKYFANRAGTIAASQVPIMTALGMRNNLFSYLTGVSFDKLNSLHRLSARVICILAWIHGGGRITVGLVDDEVITNNWVRCGPLAASSLTLLCILSIRPARERSYEIFLAIHLLFAFIFIMGMLFHLTGRTLTYYGAWPAMILWGLDRTIRTIQLLWYNRGYLLSSKSTSSTNTNPNTNTNTPPTNQAQHPLDATLTLLSPHFIRIALRRPTLHWRAGQSAFLSFPTLASWKMESHPFTIATLDDSSSSDDNRGKADNEKELIFILRVRKGLTQRLLAAAAASGADGSYQTYKVLISGPYSSPPLLIGYQRVVLIAGGSGAAFTVPLLLDVIRRARNGTSGTQHVLFVWAIRDIDHLSWIHPLLHPSLASLPPTLSLSLKFYITASSASSSPRSSSTSASADVEKWADSSSVNSPAHSVDATSSRLPQDTVEGELGVVVEEGVGVGTGPGPGPGGAEKTKPALLALPFVHAVRGRPDVDALLRDEIGAATGRVSVNVCGTHGLAESVRVALRNPRPMDILRGGPTVSLHVEAFGGA